MYLEGVAVVHVFVVAAMPTEGLGSLALFQPIGADIELLELLMEVVGKIVADGCHEADLGKERRARGEINRRAAQHFFGTLAVRGFYGVNSNATSDDQAHINSQLEVVQYGKSDACHLADRLPFARLDRLYTQA